MASRILAGLLLLGALLGPRANPPEAPRAEDGPRVVLALGTDDGEDK